MSRTLLYYPTFELPSSSWLKTSLLYWDEIGSIVPPRFDRVVDTPDLKYLSSEGFYRRFNPEQYLGDHSTATSFTDDFIQRLGSPEFAHEMMLSTSGQYWNIAFEKMTSAAWQALRDKELTLDRSSMDGWVRVKKPAAILYMGLLAKALASSDAQYVQPSTNHVEYEDVIYRCSAGKQVLPGIALSLKNLLPQVPASTPLKDVVEFKKHRRDELLRLRQTIDECQTKIANCESEDEAKLLVTQFKEKFELASSDLERMMKERGIRYTVGLMRAIFSAKSPAWLSGAVGALVGSPTLNPAAIAVTAASGFIAGGSVEAASYMLEARDKQRTLLETPFSYLYSAKRERII